MMDKPGGPVSPALSDLLIGDAIPSLLPKSILLIGRAAGALGMAEAHAVRRSDLRDRQRPRFGPRGRRFDSLRRIHRLCDRRRLLRACGRVHQRADRLGRSARRQPDAAADIRSRRRRRDDPWRGTRGTAGHDFRRLHPDDGRQHPAGAERFSLLFDRRGGNDPDPRGADRQVLQPRLPARSPHPAARLCDWARVGRAVCRVSATRDRGTQVAGARRCARAAAAPPPASWSVTPRRCASRCRPICVFAVVLVIATERSATRSGTGTTTIRWSSCPRSWPCSPWDRGR